MTTEFQSYPKPERRSKTARRQERVRKLTRAQCRAAVILREKGLCQRCGRAVTDDCWPWQDERAQVNEELPRSRGGDPLNPDDCTLLCLPCHLPGGQHAPTPERLAQIRARTKAKV